MNAQPVTPNYPRPLSVVEQEMDNLIDKNGYFDSNKMESLEVERRAAVFKESPTYPVPPLPASFDPEAGSTETLLD